MDNGQIVTLAEVVESETLEFKATAETCCEVT